MMLKQDFKTIMFSKGNAQEMQLIVSYCVKFQI